MAVAIKRDRAAWPVKRVERSRFRLRVGRGAYGVKRGKGVGGLLASGMSW